MKSNKIDNSQIVQNVTKRCYTWVWILSMTYVAVYLCPRRELPGSALHQLPAGAEGQPVQPLVLQQGLLPLMPRRTTFDLLVQGCGAPAFLH